MKKKKVNQKLKEQQSMTAGQRKQKRLESEEGYIPPITEPDSADTAARKRLRNAVLLIALPIILVIIIVVGIVIPVWYYSNYRYADNPIVVMELDNGMTLKYEVYVLDSPHLAANFLFLCGIGYFDGNIVFDTQNFWVRFGGYYLTEDKAFAHRKDDAALIAATSKYFGDHAGEETQLKYKVNKDPDVKRDTQSESAKYGLFGNHTNYCSEYSIMGRVGTKIDFTSEDNKSIRRYDVQYLAKAFDTDTENNIESMLNGHSNKFYRGWFKTIDDPFIKIKSTKVYNYEAPFTKNFEQYMTDSSSISSSWTDIYL